VRGSAGVHRVGGELGPVAAVRQIEEPIFKQIVFFRFEVFQPKETYRNAEQHPLAADVHVERLGGFA